jgi:hypothetical protein
MASIWSYCQRACRARAVALVGTWPRQKLCPLGLVDQEGQGDRLRYPAGLPSRHGQIHHAHFRPSPNNFGVATYGIQSCRQTEAVEGGHTSHGALLPGGCKWRSRYMYFGNARHCITSMAKALKGPRVMFSLNRLRDRIRKADSQPLSTNSTQEEHRSQLLTQ